MLSRAKAEFESIRPYLETHLEQRACKIEENINRLRHIGVRCLTVKFVPPADLLGLYVLLPDPIHH